MKLAHPSKVLINTVLRLQRARKWSKTVLWASYPVTVRRVLCLVLTDVLWNWPRSTATLEVHQWQTRANSSWSRYVLWKLSHRQTPVTFLTLILSSYSVLQQILIGHIQSFYSLECYKYFVASNWMFMIIISFCSSGLSRSWVGWRCGGGDRFFILRGRGRRVWAVFHSYWHSSHVRHISRCDLLTPSHCLYSL